MAFVMISAVLNKDGSAAVGASATVSQPSMCVILDTTQIATLTQAQKCVNAIMQALAGTITNTPGV